MNFQKILSKTNSWIFLIKGELVQLVCDQEKNKITANSRQKFFTSFGAMTFFYVFCTTVFIALLMVPGQASAEEDLSLRVFFGSDPYAVGLGDVVLVRADVKSADNIAADYKLELTSPGGSELNYWVWFDGHRYDQYRTDLTVEFDAFEQKTFFIGVFGGKPCVAPCSYELILKATSLATNKYYVSSTKINVNPGAAAVFTPVPEAVVLFPLILSIASAMTMYINRKRQ